MTTGYNGAPAGLKTCRERGECTRDRLNIASGTRAELCYAIHAEQNAIIQAAKLGVSIHGAAALLHAPAVQRLRRRRSIKTPVFSASSTKKADPDDFSLAIFKEAGVRLEQYKKEDITRLRGRVLLYREALSPAPPYEEATGRLGGVRGRPLL